MRAIVIAVYVGPLPDSIGLWLRSAAGNPDLDFLLVSDRDPPPLPPNVSFRRFSLAGLRDHWTGVAGVPVSLDRPYKLCDFKPLFWSLAEGLERYDYWGFCDLDLVFGSLKPLLDRTLGRYDMIMSEGHLKLMRNDERTRMAWREVRKPRDGRDMLSDPAIWGLDEHHGLNRMFRESGRSWFADPGMVADIDPGFRQLRLLPQFRNYPVQSFFWENGRVFREYWDGSRYGRDEYIYIHVQKRRLSVQEGCLEASAVDLGPAGWTVRDGSRKDREDVKARNPYRFPNLSEARIGLRELRRRLAGRGTVFQPVDQPDAAR